MDFVKALNDLRRKKAAQLPRSAGVYGEEGPVDGWLFVCTGRLEGWMMSQYLEPLPLPELAYGAVWPVRQRPGGTPGSDRHRLGRDGKPRFPADA